MEREVWIRGGMVISVLGLGALILVTPTLLGRTTPELGSLPWLIVGMPRNESFLIVYLGAVVQAYRYDEVWISVNGTQPGQNLSVAENETYALDVRVPIQVPSVGNLTIHAYLIDQHSNYFEYNVTVRAERDAGRPVLVFRFPDEKDNPTLEVKRYPPTEDFRWPIPQRGSLK